MRIAIIGDYDQYRPAHIATANAILHAAATLPFAIEAQWVATSPLEHSRNLKQLENYHGIWGTAGDPKSRNGMINAIEFARTRNIPYLGT